MGGVWNEKDVTVIDWANVNDDQMCRVFLPAVLARRGRAFDDTSATL